VREFHNIARTGKTRVWKIGVDGDQVITEFGQLDGEMQTVSDTAKAKNIGRSNEVSGEEQAVKQAARDILKKTRAGYIEVGSDIQNVTSFEDLDFAKFLPGNMRFYKPLNTMSKRIEKLLEKGDAWLSRKRDGEMVIIHFPIGKEYPVIYSRNMLRHHHLEPEAQWATRFTHICDELYHDFGEIPEGTVLLGEIVSDAEVDDRWTTARIMKLKTPESIEFQTEKKPAYFYCWDIAFWGEEDWVSTLTIRERYMTICEYFRGARYVVPVEYYDKGEIEDGLSSYWDGRYDDTWKDGYDEMEEEGTVKAMAMLYAKIQDWEGFVVIDPDGEYGDKAYNFRGKTDRPGKFCCKLKPEYEDDFVAFFDPDKWFSGNKQGKWGKGKYQGMVGAVSLYQYDTDGKLQYICECGGGMDDEFRANYSQPHKYPIVVEVKYNGRTYTSKGEKTNALQFPRIVRVRDDKEVDECINEEL